MKISQFQVMDPLDWGVRTERPRLVVELEEVLREPKERTIAGIAVRQYGPFFEITRKTGNFNQLDASYHAPRLIDISLKVMHTSPIDMTMDLKRARYELKKRQRVENWVIHLDQNHAERTGEVIYVPKKVRGNTCGQWLETHRCNVEEDLVLVETRGLRPIFLCGQHFAETKRINFHRRISA